MKDLGVRLTALLRTSFAHDALLLTAGSAIGQLIALIAMPVLSRLYTPTQFGHLAVFAAIAAVTATAVTLRYETAIPLPESDRDARALVVLSLLLALLLGSVVIACALLALWTRGLPDMVAGLDGWIVLSLCSGTAGGVLAVAVSWLARGRMFHPIAALRIGQTTLTAAAALALGFMALDGGLLIAQAIAAFAVAAAGWFGLSSAVKGISTREVNNAAVTHLAAPKFLLASSLLDVVSSQLPVLAITSKYGAELAGQFSLAWRILTLPIAVLGSAIGQVLYQRSATDIHRSPEAVEHRLVRIGLALAALALLPTILIAGFGEPMFALAFGRDWAPAGRMSELLVLAAAATFVVSPASHLLLVLGRQSVLLAFGIVQAAYRVGIAWTSEDGLQYVRVLVVFEVASAIVFWVIVLHLLRARGARAG